MMKILKLIAQCLIFSICVSILVTELCLIKARKERVGTLSYSQEYTLIPLNDVNKEFDTAIVVETDMGTEILYSIPRCFPSRGDFHAAWANENNDFFVCLRAIGVYLYMYNDDKSWTEFRIERINDEENERYIIYDTENKYGELYPKYSSYSSENVPEDVKGFIREH